MNSPLLSIKKPQRIQHWQQQLKLQLLPVDPVVKQAALHKLRSTTGTAVNVAAIVATDPVLILRLVHSANKSLFQSDNEVTSLSHAISLLGFAATEKLLSEAPEYDPAIYPQLDEFRRQLSISLHAAFQLQGWSAHNPHWAGDELFFSTLLQRAVIWALWIQAPELMQQLQQIEFNSGGHHEVLEKQLLGCSIQTLAATVSRQWHLPKLTQLSWFPSERGYPRQWIMLSRIIPEKAEEALELFPDLRRMATNKAFAVALANRLARESDWDWYSNRCRRLQNLLSNSLGILLAQAISLSHQLAASASREPALKSSPPASQLLCYYRRQDDTSAGQSADNTTPGEDPETPNNSPVINPRGLELIQQLRLKPQKYNHSLHQLLNLAVTTICRDFSFARATASLLHPSSGELRNYFSSGCDDSAALSQFHHSLQQGDLFQRLLLSPASVHLCAENRERFWPIVPDHFKQACGVEQFVVMSIFAGKKPLGLIYADLGDNSREITEQQYTVFKQLCAAINSCLGSRARTASN